MNDAKVERITSVLLLKMSTLMIRSFVGRSGRISHLNRALRRKTTPDELALLDSDGLSG
jgi:uncharacterized protein (DUF924 family)